MTYPLRSTVGAAVLAGALVLSGPVANAQPAAAAAPAVSAPLEQNTPVPGEPAPAADRGDSSQPQAAPPAGDIPSNDASDVSGTMSPDNTEEQVPSSPGTPADQPSGSEGTPEADIAGENSAANEPPLTQETVAGGEAEIPAGLLAPEGASGPVVSPVPVPAASTKAKAVSDAKPAASLPGTDLILLPEGSKDWTEEQWIAWADSEESEKWLEDNADAFEQLLESEEFWVFYESIYPFIVEGDLLGALAYLEATYPNDPLMAQFLLGFVIGQMIEEGMLDEDGNYIGDSPQEPEAEEQAGESVVKPVANITTPRAPLAKPFVRTKPVAAPAPALAETGADGIGLLAGAGGGLLLAGVGALALRRRMQA